MNSERSDGSLLATSLLAKLRPVLSLAGVLAAVAACSGGDERDPNDGFTAGTDSTGQAGGNGGTGLGGAGGDTVVPPLEGDVGTVPIHRLNNLEYNNTVRDLLGTTLRPADKFLSPELAYGFDNIAAALTMSPARVRAFYEAAKDLTEDVFTNDQLRSAIVTCQPAAAGDTTCAQQIITAFGLRAFRRPLEQAELTSFVTKYQGALDLGLDHNGAIEHVVRILLTSPQFVYRFEIDPDPTSASPRALTGYEVASRLSYLVWSSMPDNELFALAETSELLQDAVIHAQVDRMLADHQKSAALAESFAAQWFGTVRLAKHSADVSIYPEWDETLRSSMQQEMNLYFNEFLYYDRPYAEFLTADVNFVDDKLAALYGMPLPGGTGLTRTEFTADERRGFLGLAGFLTHTSRGNRTAPTIRAKWVLSALQCRDVEPPPDVVIQPLPESDPLTEELTVREQIALHAENGACAPCHSVVDPVGLALEHYDAIGKHRSQYLNGDPVDANAVLPGSGPVDGLVSLSDALSAKPELVSCAAKKLLVYGLGRDVKSNDFYLGELSEGWQAEGSVLRNLIKHFVISDVSRYRRGSPE